MNDPSTHTPPSEERLRQCLADRFGFDRFRPGQREALDPILNGRNLISVMPTGSGKSLCYQLPALLFDGVTLVVSPLIALMKDQTDELARLGIEATFINSSISMDEQHRRMEAVRKGEQKILYVAPERFQSRRFLDLVSRVKISLLAVDEAHCISSWGHDFRPDYLRLRRFMELMDHPPVACFTATATPRVQEDIARQLGLSEAETLVTGFDRENLLMSVQRASSDPDKEEFLEKFLLEKEGTGIVYVGTRKQAESVAEFLNEIGVTALPYHAGMEPDDRTKVQNGFMDGSFRAIVATIAFGMGIDKENVRFVIHYTIPGTIEAYYQEAGRAGRDGEAADCVLLYAPQDIFLRRFFIDQKYPTPEQVEAVYDTLYDLGENPILRTYREIAGASPVEISDGGVGASLRILRHADVVDAVGSSDNLAHVTTAAPLSTLKERLTGAVRSRIVDGLSSLLDLEAPGHFSFALDELCAAAGLDEDQVRRGLNSMSQTELLSYSPPFRGRGVVLLGDKRPFDDVAIDWKQQQQRRAYEEFKLNAMVDYATSRECRRKLILRYFGEDTSEHECAGCDNCERPSGAAAADIDADASGDRLTAAILRCVDELKWAVGKIKIAQVLNGSKAKWIVSAGLDELPSHGSARVGQEYLVQRIEDLVATGLLEQMGREYPTISLAPSGREFLAAAPEREEEEPVRRPAAAEEPRGSKRKRTRSGAADPAEALLRCVSELPWPVGKNKVAQLVNGSRASWVTKGRLERLSSFGAAPIGQEALTEKIDELIASGHIVQSMGTRPTVSLSELGLQAVMEAKQDEASAPEPEEDASVETAPEEAVPDALFPEEESTVPSAGGVLQASITLLCSGDRTAAREALENLRLFRSDAVSAELTKHFDDAPDDRARSRILWALGELGAASSRAFLSSVAQGPDPELRRLAAAALRKLGEGE